MKLKAPDKACYGSGWMIGMVNGQKWYSDGYIMCLCKRDPPKPNCALLEGAMQKEFNATVGRRMKRMHVKKTGDTEYGKPLILAIFRGNVAIQQKYYDHVRTEYPGAQFFLGRAVKNHPGARPIVAKQGKQAVAVIMPVRLP